MDGYHRALSLKDSCSRILYGMKKLGVSVGIGVRGLKVACLFHIHNGKGSGFVFDKGFIGFSCMYLNSLRLFGTYCANPGSKRRRKDRHFRSYCRNTRGDG